MPPVVREALLALAVALLAVGAWWGLMVLAAP